MKLEEVFTSLAYGELSQVFLGTETEGELTEANYPKLVNHINLGLTDLYKRFNLKENQLTLVLQSDRLTYPLTPAFAQSNTRSTEPVKYIDDTGGAPFLGDLLKIERLYDSDDGELVLNDVADPESCTTPSLQTLRVTPTVLELNTALTVVYRANHPMLVVSGGTIDPTRTELELPMSHLQALLYFVASRVHNPIGMGQEFNAGNNWAARYEAECQALELTNLQVDRGGHNTRFEQGGWV